MELPILLAGPILRRVDQEQIYIWMALSQPYLIEATLYKIHGNEEENFSYEKMTVDTETSEVVLGKRFYGYLVKVTPKDRFFPKDILLGYNLILTNSFEQRDLKSFHLLSKDNPNSIIYGSLRYPTFFIPQENKEILFGSCRKMHGKGKDALACGDKKVKESSTMLDKRPSALFLLGDQIYADDVADPILPFIQRLGRLLIGTDEDLAALDERLETEPFRRAIRQVRGRQYVMERLCHFTSNHAHNHLITFGEFAAMYLLSLNPELWELVEQDSFPELVKRDDYYFIFPKKKGYEEEFSLEFTDHYTRYKKQLQELQLFKKSLPNIQRLLANIPTYMLFDDHDITDDLNISLKWKENVESSPLGSHVIANGLAANWFFQSWGNAPEEFPAPFLDTITDYAQTYHVQSQAYTSWKELLFRYKRWSFVAPTYPKALFMDTRMQRSFSTNKSALIAREPATGPQLISEDGWDILSSQLKSSGWKSGDPLILVTPSPFYGIGLIESFLRQFGLPLKNLRLPVQTTFDIENWQFNDKAVNNFYQKISDWNPSSCIILSGDAHMGSSVETIITFEDGETRKIQQFTSSPLKNNSFSPLTKFLIKGFLRLYTWVKGNKELTRSCPQDYLLQYSIREDSQTWIWQEKFHYLTFPNGSIVETENQLGQLSFSTESGFILLKPPQH